MLAIKYVVFRRPSSSCREEVWLKTTMYYTYVLIVIVILRVLQKLNCNSIIMSIKTHTYMGFDKPGFHKYLEIPILIMECSEDVSTQLNFPEGMYVRI